MPQQDKPIQINLNLSLDSPKLDEMLRLLNQLITGNTHMSQELDALTTQVTTNTTVEESAVTLIQGLAAQITAAGVDPVALAALTTSLTTSASDLAAAVAANTAPVVVPDPTTPTGPTGP